MFPCKNKDVATILEMFLLMLRAWMECEVNIFVFAAAIYLKFAVQRYVVYIVHDIKFRFFVYHTL